MSSSKIVLIFSFIIVIIIIIVYRLCRQNRYNLLELFEETSITKTLKTFKNSNERTILYGSLFLDNLDKQISNMTNPPIEYDNKRIELIRYSDVLLL